MLPQTKTQNFIAFLSVVKMKSENHVNERQKKIAEEKNET